VDLIVSQSLINCLPASVWKLEFKVKQIYVFSCARQLMIINDSCTSEAIARRHQSSLSSSKSHRQAR